MIFCIRLFDYSTKTDYMQHFLPQGLAMFVHPMLYSISKRIRTLFLVSGILLVFSMQANAQAAGNETIMPWTALEEADFYFDVSFTVVKCNPVSKPEILLNAFNEGGNVDAVGFTLKLTDKDGNEATVEIEKFTIGQAEMFIASCSTSDYENLRFEVPEGLDPSSISIDITYNK